MSTTYTKSLSTDFSGVLNSSQLHSQIKGNTLISSANLIGINTSNDIVNIVFDTNLSVGDETMLDNIISNYNPDLSKPKKQFFTISGQSVKDKTNSYVLSRTFNYEGSDNIGIINYIEIIAKKDVQVNNYNLRIINSSTGDILAEKIGLTNNNFQVIDLGDVSNIPLEKTILELQVKKSDNSSKEIKIESIIVYYGN